MFTALITGANRGIGFEFVKQYATDGWQVMACCREPVAATNLRSLIGTGDKIRVYTLDVDDQSSIDALKREIDDEPIDLLINNAGVIGQRNASIGDIDYKSWANCMSTNVFGPMRVAEGFCDNVATSKQKKLVTISSRMGSIGLNDQATSIVYRSSKAAVNMVMKCLANGFAARGIIVASFHPGWVRTDMGGSTADISAHESAASMKKVIGTLTSSDNGCFRNYDGTKLDW